MSTILLRRLALTGIVMAGVAFVFVTPAYAAADGWITNRVKLHLLTSEDVSAAKHISVDTTEGIVALHGKVNTEEEKQKAEQAARSVEGVVSVKNLIEVVPPPKDKGTDDADGRLRKAVTKNLKRDKSLEHIHVTSVDNGVVELSGEAATIDEELQAVRIAADTNGVRRVKTQIKANAPKETVGEGGEQKISSVSSSEHEAVSQESPARKLGRKISKATSGVAFSTADSRITSEIKVRYMGDSRVPARDINVDTHRGAVTLFGVVPTHEAKQVAEKSARQVSGVRSVSNELQVVPKEEREQVAAKDDDIEKNVESAFKNMKAFEKVDVSSANGVVRLTGQVATLDDRARAARIARLQTGVRAVEDEIKVAK